jgi:HEAT repeat protein
MRMPDREQAIAQLGDRASAKRRSAAKHLRRLADPGAGPALLAALEAELKDERTWETQYQMIMALGICGFREAAPFIEELSRRPLKATMVYMAIGDALVRLSRAHEHDASKAVEMLSSGNDSLIDGAIQAVAMLRMKPSEAEIDAILRFARALDLEDRFRLCPAVAAAGWRGELRDLFLAECARSPDKALRDAAEHSMQGRYRILNPL